MSNHDVVVVGTVCCDIIFHGLPSFPKLGEEVWTEGMDVTAGGAINSPAALSRLGINVGIVTPLGKDIWGEIIHSKIKAEGICTDLIYKLDKSLPQVSVAMNYQNDRAFVSYGEKVEVSDFHQHIEKIIRESKAKLFHFYANSEPGHTEMILEAKRNGKIISLDTGWDPEWLTSERIKEQIALSDIFLPNLSEARLITGKDDKYEALDALAEIVPNVVIKLGEDGAIAYTKGKVYESEAAPQEVVDATGAGDCFIAGYLYGWLNNRSTLECLKLGNYCGGACVTSVGGYTNAPTEAELNVLLAETDVKN
ncbi:carbohydrate kinase family protein [Bacillus shivajii]|uniref:carbohydrate kinase family protein n=1 Tax=Bacillus shivajii TaxID=1983719 RepID=UPI001CFAD7BD|nr:carbohydrate kinase family protein [Bacillus shivajii]UCZ52805.1 carbohydrate kinase family protein [Bacillus shivajii]